MKNEIYRKISFGTNAQKVDCLTVIDDEYNNPMIENIVTGNMAKILYSLLTNDILFPYQITNIERKIYEDYKLNSRIFTNISFNSLDSGIYFKVQIDVSNKRFYNNISSDEFKSFNIIYKNDDLFNLIVAPDEIKTRMLLNKLKNDFKGMLNEYKNKEEENSDEKPRSGNGTKLVLAPDDSISRFS